MRERCRPGSVRGLYGGGCLSAMLEVLLCPVFASFSPMAIFYINLVLQIKNSHWVKLEMTIRFVFFFPVIDLLV